MSKSNCDRSAEVAVRFHAPNEGCVSSCAGCAGHSAVAPKRRWPQGTAAAFLDRDGVINNNGNYVNSADDFELLPGAADAVRRLNDAGIPVIVVTNQGSVALEYITREALEAVHDKMDRLLAERGAHVDAVYAALTHVRGSIPHLATESRYRKPDPGMIEQAEQDLGVDPSRSFMVGDASTDILAGKRAGCRTILVNTGFAGGDGNVDVTPDVTVADLAAAVEWILGSACGREWG